MSSKSRIIGQGEMADLIRAFAWRRTPIGPIDTWSDTLVTTVNLLLASRHPMFLWWGPDLIQFYNDGYRPCLRADKHPSAVGQRGAQCWPEIWPIIGPQIEAVMTRGESTWNVNQLVPINRNGKLEEVYWTYGYSPVRDQDGAVRGTLVVCTETTDQVLAYANLEKKVVERTAALEAEIAERKCAEIGLRELTGRLLLAQDEERRRMGRELHDQAGQTLAALGMNLSMLRNTAGHLDPKINKLASESQELTDELSKEIRTLSYLLHPPLLDEVGLASALRWYTRGFSERSEIDVDLDLPPAFGRVPKDLELVVFRIVQESLTNIHRHSGSSTARVAITRFQNSVAVEVTDHGRGIAPEKLQQLTAAKAGVGVRGMEERVRQLGGTFEITSSPQGTRVAVSLPLTA